MQPLTRHTEHFFYVLRRGSRGTANIRAYSTTLCLRSTSQGEALAAPAIEEIPSRKAIPPTKLRKEDGLSTTITGALPYVSAGQGKGWEEFKTAIKGQIQSIESDFEKRQRSFTKTIFDADPDFKKWSEFKSSVLTALTNTELGTATEQEVELVRRLRHGPTSRLDSASVARIRRLRAAALDYILPDDEHLPTVYDMRYPTEWYPDARQMQRKIHLHVGPTNSGKTYTALKKLEESKNGFYAGPLRLLAHEVYSRFNNRGIDCELMTGDDVRIDPNKDISMYSSTVEMVDLQRECAVGVIDEIQMLGSDERGWAWTRALLGARAHELHLCGEARVVPLVKEIVASMGDTLYIHQYERLSPLKVMSRSLGGDLKKLKKGDCVVSFSIATIHAMKQQIERETGRRCAIVYGSLPPHTRARQAELFNDPDNDYDFLVASDAIGMGLNLAIRRVVFETIRKFNGSTYERLNVAQLKQIAGRAGRYRTAQDDKKPIATAMQPQDSPPELSEEKEQRVNGTGQQVGLVTCLSEADLPYIQQCMMAEPAPLKAAGLLPPGEIYEDLALRLPLTTPFEYIVQRVHQSASLNDRFVLCNPKEILDIARAIDPVHDLSLRDRLLVCASPAGLRGTDSFERHLIEALAYAISKGDPVTIADIADIPLEVLDEPMVPDGEYLRRLERLHKSLVLYLWLSYRFSRVLTDPDMAIHAKTLTEANIDDYLRNYSANPELVKRLVEMKTASEQIWANLKPNDKSDPHDGDDSNKIRISRVVMDSDASPRSIKEQARQEWRQARERGRRNQRRRSNLGRQSTHIGQEDVVSSFLNESFSISTSSKSSKPAIEAAPYEQQ